MPTQLSDVVEASEKAAQTSSRLAKRDAIAACLRGADADEIETAVAWLSGETRQGRIGVGYASLAALRGAPAEASTLTLRDVDSAFEEITAASGKGSAAARSARLGALFARDGSFVFDFLLAW